MKESLVLSAQTRRILDAVEPLVFARRKLTLAVLAVITIVLLAFASQLKPDAGYEKTIPLDHPYMAVYKEYQRDFGGANIVLVAIQNTRGDIYQPGFLEKLRKVTDDVFFLPNVDRARVSSLFTPSTRYIEVVEDGLRGADVIPANYSPSPEMTAQIRSNVRKSGVIGRLVANDERGAMVFAEMLEVDPVTGNRMDYKKVADQLEAIRSKYEKDGVTVHIIGFAKVVGDMTDATAQVFMFFLLTLLLTTGLLWLYCGALRMAVMPLACALVSVMWNFGLLVIFGMGLDPFAVLVPFLVLSISISHGVQYVNAWVTEVDAGNNSFDASKITFRRFAIPGTIALLTAVIGFVTIMLIQIEAIQDMALNASLGCLAIIITNKVLMPIWLSYMPVSNASQFKEAQRTRERLLDPCWHQLKKLTRPVPSKLVILGAILVTIWGATHYKDLHIGDIQKGVPELRADSRYNQDTAVIVDNYALGADVLKVIAEAGPDACIDYKWMQEVDTFAWRMQNVDGVVTAFSGMTYARQVYVGFNEGRPQADTVPRNPQSLSRMTSLLPSSAGLFNSNCSAMPVFIYLKDHKAQTLEHVVEAVKTFNAERESNGMKFRLATGNAGVMAATNEVIHADEMQVVLGVFAIIVLFVWLSFRDLASVLSICLPLAMVSVLAYAFMAILGIGLKVATLPVLAMAVGIGVDYGIYHYAILQESMGMGMKLEAAHYRTLQRSGKAVIFTGFALSLSVAMWMFSELQFQRDMGMLLAFMFLANMVAAVLLVPAITRYMIPHSIRD
jgi:hypothetical protein